MADRVYQPERVFQLWSYTVGMGKLLLRSVKTASSATRIDILFQNVQALKLPTVLHGLTILSSDARDIEQISAETGLLPDDGRIFFVLSGSHYDGYIVAGVMTTCEDAGEYFEASKLWSPPA
jgi:hypothetical protein